MSSTTIFPGSVGRRPISRGSTTRGPLATEWVVSGSAVPNRLGRSTVLLVGPASRVARPTTMVRGGSIVPIRERDTLALGSLVGRLQVEGDRLVTAHDRAGHSWWIPAVSVWSDADGEECPEHPRPVGLATASTTDRVLVAGLSDRLGWEAVLEFERGAELPELRGVGELATDQVVVLDGRLGHDVPTVVVLGPDFVRWGAGATWDRAVRRAFLGDDGSVSVATELDQIAAVLAMGGLEVVAVDLATPVLRRAGIVRGSVQLVASNGTGR